jgi:cell division cycle 2-like protein
LTGLLCFDPAKRLTAQQALDHPYFSESPLPKHPELMPVFASLHVPEPPQAAASTSSSNALKRKAI